MKSNQETIGTKKEINTPTKRGGCSDIKAKKLRSALIKELDLQSDLASKAFEELKESIKKGDENQIWYSIHMFLSTSGYISELLKEMEKLSDKNSDCIELDELTSLLELSKDLKIKQQELVENFGEELERWVVRPENNLVIENHIFQKKSVPNLDVKNMLRHFDPETYEMTFRDETYDLKEHQEEIKKVKENVEEIYRKNLLYL
ncbi:MAG: hypothetical protein ACOC85_02660 [Thermoplasmatota archaeon]